MITDSLLALDRYLMEADYYPRLLPEEECDLARRYQRGDEEAGHYLVCCNLCLAISVTNTYSVNARCERLDLIQQANMGLIRAAKKYNPDSGYRFSTYAVSSIIAAVTRYRDERSYAVHMPQYVIIAERKEKRGESVAKAARTLDAAYPWLNSECYSLDGTIPGQESEIGTYAELLEDPSAEEAFAHVFDCSEVAALLDQLPDRWRQVIELLYGFVEVEQAHNSRTIGKRFGVSRTRIEQIERQALQRLRKVVAEGAAS